ncbi:MAG: hypothetical protein HY689_16080 [Chloroflexi bacterium]|nr:hypothetical protein [Chloroflexota bacterium]
MPKTASALYTIVHPAPAAILAPLGRAPLVSYWKNFLLEFQVQAHPLGTGPTWAGWDLTLRKGLPNGDIVALDEEGADLVLAERISGNWFMRGQYAVTWQANRWYTIRVKLQNASITVWLDGTQVLSYASLTVQTPGYLLFDDALAMDGGHRTYRVTRCEVLP